MWSDRRRPEGSTQTPFNGDSADSYAQRDRARIIHSAAFRRLQSKTQILGIGENDFYRTRLTHSLEVAQIGSGISERLREQYRDDSDIHCWIPSLSQIESICLAHDIGHPPFGHGGEVAINYFMHNQGGFEGNGQTLRIVAKLGEYSLDSGLDLTRRTLLGLLKYPVLHRDVAPDIPSDDSLDRLNIDKYRPPKCIHDEELDILQWILQPIAATDAATFVTVAPQNGKLKSKYKAFDTSIMELADDISYGVHDLEDALALGMVTQRQWQENVVEQLSGDNPISQQTAFYTEKLFSDSNRDRKHAISKLVTYLIGSISVQRQGVFDTSLLDLQATMDTDAEQTLETLKSFVMRFVIKRPEVKALEYKGQQMILRLFEVLKENPSLLPESTQRKLNTTDQPDRVISDYISGMTDNYATKLYHKLFSPQIGSVFDRI